MKDKLKELWSKIEAWDAAQPDETSLNEPLSQKEALELESRIGLELPVDFMDSLKIHNGTDDCTMAFCGGYFYSASDIQKTITHQRGLVAEIFGKDDKFKEKINITGPIKRTYWSRSWIPFHSTDWCETCIDLDPAEGGIVGQIIEVSRETRDLTLVSKDYIEFLQKCVDELPTEPL
jgi:molybdopterin molybdotransferase